MKIFCVSQFLKKLGYGRVVGLQVVFRIQAHQLNSKKTCARTIEGTLRNRGLWHQGTSLGFRCLKSVEDLGRV